MARADTLTRIGHAFQHVRKALTPSPSKYVLLDMLSHNWHLGLTAFGGPTVHFQIFRELFVEKYAWLDDTSYDELFGLCQALSGPASTKMLFAINVMHYNSILIGILAFCLWSLPMAIASCGLAIGVRQIDDQLPGPAYALLSGLNSATVGIVALAAVQLGQKAVTDKTTRILVFLGATAGMLYNALWYFPVLIAAGGIVTVVTDLKLLQKVWKRKQEPSQLQSTTQLDLVERRETSSVRSRHSTARDLEPTSTASVSEESAHAIWKWKTGLIVIAAFLASFLIVMVCRGVYSGQNRPFDLFANFYLAGTIIFGGGPVVIPLLREYAVTPGWVQPRDFLLGLAITQAFPGPNFNFAVYLGALAVQGSISPVAGSIIAFLAIFTPGMWLVTGCLGIWSSIRKVQAVRACLRGIHAAAVGLVFTAVYRLFEIGYLDEEVRNGGSLSRDPWWVVIVATSFVGGMHFKLSPPLAIVLGAAMGLIWYGVART